jgi:AbrB family looped-hinge helix DNA binding protein
MYMTKRSAVQPELFTTIVSSKGQVVLPAQVRSRFGLRKGTRITIALKADKAEPIVLRPVTSEAIRRLRGAYKSAGAALEFLESERRKERERGR